MATETQTGLRIRQLLDKSASQLPAAVQKQLKMAVRQAMVQHHIQTDQAAAAKASPSFGLAGWLFGWLKQPVASFALSLSFMAASATGIVLETLKTEQAIQLASMKLDLAILVDDLPPEAWLDPGFVVYSSEMETDAWAQEEEINQWLEQVGQGQPQS